MSFVFSPVNKVLKLVSLVQISFQRHIKRRSLL